MAVGGGATTIAGKTITPAQLQYYRQQAALKQQLKLQQQGVAKAAGTVASAGGGSQQQLAVVAAGSMSQPRATAQFVRQAVVATAAPKQGGLTRTVSEAEMATLIKRQQQLQQKALQQQGSPVQALTQAQILAHSGIQVGVQALALDREKRME